MKHLTRSLIAVCVLSLTGATAAFAGVTDYQVTGPVTAVTDTMISVTKGKEKFDIAKDANTKGPADVKVGDKVTVHYTMTALTVESKPAPAAKKDAKAAPAPAPATAATPAAAAPAAAH